MNAFLIAAMVLGAAAMDMDSEVGADLSKSAEFILIEHAMNDIADRISKITLKETEFNLGAFDWIDNDTQKADDLAEGKALITSMLEKTDVEKDSGLKRKTTEKRSCKSFEDTRFFTNSNDKFATVIGHTWEACLKSCEENLLCAQVIFDKEKKECKGYRMANTKTATGFAPEQFMSGHCKTEASTSMLQTEDMSDDAEVEVKIDAAQMEQIKKFEEQLNKYDKANPPKVEAEKPTEEKPKAEKAEPEKFDAEKMKADIKAQMEEVKEKAKKRFEDMKEKMKPKKAEKKSSLLATRKCTTFETQHLKKRGSLLQMGKKLVTSETTGDFLTCLHKCQQDATCKQVVYDKEGSQCYKHDEVVVKAIESKFTTRYIGATCQ